ncbi:hypothetical protein C2869_04315 [Saccharobesus litoralis]|uniref:Uncharacterized protein n=1 Tax=Saccharobesus litoralis TaxID=2172099 RepID=A0A2S0VNQ5_9ALTE|nr:hypothetical protein [Saccharobesus litoralis]AWB65710.1 hypothetical protein C2869_04315 [Saccharobesus litoralis]
MKKVCWLLIACGLCLSVSSMAEPQKKRKFGPPPEAIEACKGKAEGQEVSFTTRRGDELDATCRKLPEFLVAVPNKHKLKAGKHKKS